MLVILWMGVAAELIFFPALLAGPLGSVFKPRARKEDKHLPASDVVDSNVVEVAALATNGEQETTSVPQPAGKASILNHLRQDNSHSRRRT
jgi:hypothetical protein